MAMNIALNPPSHDTETSFLSYGLSNPTPAGSSFRYSPARESTREASRSLSPQGSSSLATFPTTIRPQQYTDHESMDQELTTTSPQSIVQHTSRVSDLEETANVIHDMDGQNHDRMDIDEEEVSSYLNGLHPAYQSPPPRLLEGPDFSLLPGPPLSSGSNTPVGDRFPLPDETVATENDIPDALERTQTNSTAELVPEGENDRESGDESSNHEDDGFWSNYQPDNSSPSEEELVEMTRREEISALDHNHWESIIFESVDDPEHTVDSVGRISWTIHGLHGTKEHPNRERIMRSPSVNIGGYVWNLKLLPRGDETTSFISLYVECTGPAIISEDKLDQLGYMNKYRADPCKDNAVESSDADESHQGSQTSTPVDNQLSANNEAVTKESDAGKTATSARSSSQQATWNIAAQIGCVMYNPNEPRVRVHEKSTHNFENSSKDWGWVRFYGSWETIHLRQHLQRQALLHDDTISFTAYIRTFRDDTKALWWHRGKENGWNDLVKTGHRGMTIPGQSGKALVAALSAWVHLRPFQDIIDNAPFSTYKRPGVHMRPLYDNLKDILRAEAAKSTPAPLSLETLLRIFEWHDWDLESNPDVVEIWDTIQFLLNQEYYDTDNDVPVPNIFKDFALLRQTNYAHLSASYEALLNHPQHATISAHSTQEILDNLVNGFQRGNTIWTRHGGISGPSTMLPSVLQLELPRQCYDTTARKWKKLTHHIALREVVVLQTPGNSSQPGEYTLSGIVVHAGTLGSGEYYTITRPGGQQSQWLQYKGTDGHEQYVKRLTNQQAITAHEGTGARSEGEAAVAYLALYVRSDVLMPCITKPELSFEKNLVVAPDPTSALREPTPVLEFSVVHVFDSELFRDWGDRGMLDPWGENKTLWDNQLIVKLELNSHTSIREVKAELINRLRYQMVQSEQLRIWAILATPRGGPHNANRVAPLFVTDNPDVRLSAVANGDGICRLWLHVLSLPLLEAKQTLSSAPVVDVNLSISEERAGLLGDQPVSVSDDSVMSGTQEQDTAPTIGVDLRLENEQYLQALEASIYIFVKRFDVRSQKLWGVGSYFVERHKTIGEFLSGLGFADEKVDIFVEVKTICWKLPIPRATTFQAEHLKIGAAIIMQARLPEAEIKEIRQRGGFTTVRDYYVYLVRNIDPAFKGMQQQQSYFGKDYIDSQIMCGRFHGRCVHIKTDGNAYFGNTVAGTYSGSGTMFYANGDTYTGGWADDLPNGQGQMIYAKTGNTYAGTWLNGKRHGKGVMHFEVADEEMETCRICYEAQIDALFYRCGHVVACEECAKQVEVCPICRVAVSAVVKMWKA